MLQLYDDKKNRIGTLNDAEDICIEKVLHSGDKTLSFKFPQNDKIVGSLHVEYYVRTKTDEYVIKEIDIGDTYNLYNALMNVEELEETYFQYGFASREQTIRTCLEFAFEGSGWSIGNCFITKKRTIEEEGYLTAWDVLQKAISAYHCEIEVDSINKVIDIYETLGEDKGCYFAEDLNLRKMQLKTDTYSFYTRIIPIGKDGIGLWLDGKNYLENFQYSSKVKTLVWKDDRYENTTSLQEDAQVKLEEISRPYKVYSADVIDLASMNNVYKDILDYKLGDIVYIISKKNKVREKQRIVKMKEFPKLPQNNTVELSNTVKSFAEIQKTDIDIAKTESIDIAKSSTKKVLGEYEKEIESKITASKDEIELSVSEKLKDYETEEETEAKIELAAKNITQTVSEKINGKEIVSRINQTSEDITIDALKINLNGYVTVSDLSGDGTTEINGKNITTGYIMSRNYLVRDSEGEIIYNPQGNATETGEGTLINLDNGYGKYAGKFNYAWLDEEESENLASVELKEGFMRIWNAVKNRSLYATAEGIATTPDANNATGVIDFFSKIYGQSKAGTDYKGITVQTNNSPIGLRSLGNHIFIEPEISQADGNMFDFNVSSQSKYGTISWGSGTYTEEDVREYASQLRFSPDVENPFLRVTDKENNLAPLYASNLPEGINSISISDVEFSVATKTKGETYTLTKDSSGRITKMTDSEGNEVKIAWE